MRFLMIIAALLLLPATNGRAAGGEGQPVPTADGVLQFVPPQAVSGVAIRVEVPEGKMLTGVRWYNGSGSEAFPQVLVASGNDFQPPPRSEAVAVAQDVRGLEQAWSELAFTVPVASQSGTLFVVLEYPANYAPAPDQPALGVGYANQTTEHHCFVTGDGEQWYRVASRCRVLLEPVLADRLPGIVALREPQDVEEQRLGLFAAPNPFNPETRIDLVLESATTGTVRIMDLRGRKVAELHHGALTQGRNTFVWKGRDDGGRAVASGVYWVLAQTADRELVRKLLLVK